MKGGFMHKIYTVSIRNSYLCISFCPVDPINVQMLFVCFTVLFDYTKSTGNSTIMPLA